MASEFEEQSFIEIRTDGGSGVYYSVLHKGIPEEYKLVALQTLNETDENKKNCLKKLKAFVKDENLSCSDDDLILVMRCCKYNRKKSETKLKRFLRFRKQVVKKLLQLDEKKIQLILDDMAFGVLPYRDKYGRTILFTRPSLRVHLYNIDEVIVLCSTLLLYILSFPLTSVCGISYIADGQTGTLSIYYPILKSYGKIYEFLTDLPIRVGRVDATYMNILACIFHQGITPFIPSKIKKRIFIHGNEYDTMKQFYHPDILPENFGGNLGPISDKFYREKLWDFIQKLRDGNLDS